MISISKISLLHAIVIILWSTHDDREIVIEENKNMREPTDERPLEKPEETNEIYAFNHTIF